MSESRNELYGAEGAPCILYCHCAYAQVVPEEVKREVLARLGASGAAFEAVADLCEMSARRDPGLKRIASSPQVRIAACFPRAVKWLFHAAGSPLADGAEILNMREQGADDVISRLLQPGGCGRQPEPPGGESATAGRHTGAARRGDAASAADVATSSATSPDP